MAYCMRCGAKLQDGNANCFQCEQAKNHDVAASATDPETVAPVNDSNAPIVPNFFQTIGICLRKYVNFRGRASRSEYWYWQLFLLLIGFGIGFALYDHPSAVARMGAILNLVLLPASTAVFARRLHDTNYSGWWSIIYMLLMTGFAVIRIKYPEENPVDVVDSWLPKALYDDPVATVFYVLSSAVFFVSSAFCLLAPLRSGTRGQNKYGPQPIRRR